MVNGQAGAPARSSQWAVAGNRAAPSPNLSRRRGDAGSRPSEADHREARFPGGTLVRRCITLLNTNSPQSLRQARARGQTPFQAGAPTEGWSQPKTSASPSWPLANGQTEIPCAAKTCRRREQLLLILHFSFCNLHFAICNSRCDFGHRPHGQTVGCLKRTTIQLQKFTASRRNRPPCLPHSPRLPIAAISSYFLQFSLTAKISLSFPLISSHLLQIPRKIRPPTRTRIGPFLPQTHKFVSQTDEFGRNLPLFRRPKHRL